MPTETVYYLLSAATAVLAVIALISARRAMQRGLQYSAFAVTVWTLGFIAVARIVHVLREFLALEALYGESPEMIEYLFYLIAYAIFIWLVHRSELLRGQERPLK